ncbi:GAF domain-containing protein [Pseudonocardia yuanmonensis]|uniref:GAF domain-containing protein n=1 Tax=Pseudonocardia yuanmonensis TaxID=1095914 RepID=UPI0031EB4AE2
MGLTLQVGRTAVAGADLTSLLSSVCTALPTTLGVSGAAIVLVDSPDRVAGVAGVSASDTAAGRLGEMELRAGTGPVQGAVRSGRPMVTPDLTRIGPPELAAAAADTGLTCSVVVPLVVDGEPVGGLQLFGHPGRPVGDGHVDAVAGLAEVLSARIADVWALRRLTATVARLTAEHEAALPVAHATGMLAERYRTDVEEAARYLASRARKGGVEPAEAARAVLDRTDDRAAAGEDPPTEVLRVVAPDGRGEGPAGRREGPAERAEGPAGRGEAPAGRGAAPRTGGNPIPSQRRPEEERSRSGGGRRRLADDHPAATGAPRSDAPAGRRAAPEAERSRGSRSEPRGPRDTGPREPRRSGAPAERRADAPGPGAPDALPPVPHAPPGPQPRHGGAAPSPGRRADRSAGHGEHGEHREPREQGGRRGHAERSGQGGHGAHGAHRPPSNPAPAAGGGKRRLREPAGEVLPGRDPWDLDQAALPGIATPERPGGRRRAEDRPDAPRVPQQREGERRAEERSAPGRRAAPSTPDAPPIPGSGAPRARHRRADIT